MRQAVSSLFCGVSALALALACRATAPEPVTRVEPPAPAAAPGDAGAGGVTEIDLAETTIELDGKPVRITKADADALARALIERIPQSQLPPGAREMLLAITFSHGFIEGEGDVRIGPWVLTEFLSSGWGLLLRFSPDDPARYTGYFAPVTRGEAGLQVGEVQPVIFHPPRHPQR